MSARRLLVLGMALVFAFPLTAMNEDPWPDPGPPSSRDLFPLNLVPLTYRPVGVETIGQGQLRVSLQVTRSNTFEFSDLIKDHLRSDVSGRLTVDRVGVAQLASAFTNEPLIFFFDAEIQRTELSLRYGLAPNTDLAMTLAWQGMGGGFMDGMIEGFHRLGFEQTGRNAIAQNQMTSLIVQHGQVVHFTQTSVRLRPVDPVVAVIHRFYVHPKLTLGFLGALQIPATRFAGALQSDWDSSAGVGFQWRPTHDLVIHGGGAYLRRGLKGGVEPSPFLIKDQIAGHLGWEWRGWSRIRPFVVFIYHDSLTSQGPGATLDKPSVIHDLGLHLRIGSRSALTFSYINNITHNENTADMGLALRLSVRP